MLPPFLDEWVAFHYAKKEPALWNDMAKVCGFDKLRASDIANDQCDVYDKVRVWQYRDVKLPVSVYVWYYDRLWAQGATLSPSELRGIPGLDHTEDEWQQYKPVSPGDETGRIIHLRRRVSKRASLGASHRCKMKWGPDVP